MLKDLTLRNAELAKMAGVSVHTIRSWKAGRLQPSPEARRRLAKALTRYLGRVERIIHELEREE